MKRSNKVEIAAARRDADKAARDSGGSESAATWAANSRLADALDKGNIVDRLFR